MDDFHRDEATKLLKSMGYAVNKINECQIVADSVTLAPHLEIDFDTPAGRRVERFEMVRRCG